MPGQIWRQPAGNDQLPHGKSAPPLISLCADGSLSLQALLSCLLWLAFQGGIREGSGCQVPAPARWVAKRAAEGQEMLPLAAVLKGMSCEPVRAHG